MDLLKKLGIKRGQVIHIFGDKHGVLRQLLGSELSDDEMTYEGSIADTEAVCLFVEQRDELKDQAQALVTQLRYDQMFWVMYPKKTGKIASDLNRDVVHETVLSTGLRAVRQVAVDETWSALRFRPHDAVKTKPIA